MKKIILISYFILTGCAWTMYSNERLESTPTETPSHASFLINMDRGNENVLTALALSGGGSRSAYLSAKIMLELQNMFEDIDLLQEVDVISSVSGGSIPASYYCLSENPGRATIVKYFSEFDENKISETTKKQIIHDENFRKKKLLGFSGKMSEEQKLELLKAFKDQRSQDKIHKLYNLTQFDLKARRKWEPKRVKKLMKRNYLQRWILNWFWPQNVVLYWTSPYDRSDILAQTFADSLFDAPFHKEYILSPWRIGKDFKFRHLNPERPYLILNTAESTENEYVNGKIKKHFGCIFTFTKEDFEIKLNSDINKFPLAKAVVASAAFPAALNNITLRDYSESQSNSKKYRHFFDGGNVDNLGLTTIQKVIQINKENYDRFVVILVDAFTEPTGASKDRADTRELYFFERFIDLNFLYTFDSLLTKNRKRVLNAFDSFKKQFEDNNNNKKIIFCHITFEDLEEDENGELKRKLDSIPTNFMISDEHTELIDKALKKILDKNRDSLNEIREVVLNTAQRKTPKQKLAVTIDSFIESENGCK